MAQPSPQPPQNKKKLGIIALITILVAGTGAYFLSSSEGLQGFFRLQRFQRAPVTVNKEINIAQEEQRRQEEQKMIDIKEKSPLLKATSSDGNSQSDNWWCMSQEEWEKKWGIPGENYEGNGNLKATVPKFGTEKFYGSQYDQIIVQDSEGNDISYTSKILDPFIDRIMFFNPPAEDPDPGTDEPGGDDDIPTVAGGSGGNTPGGIDTGGNIPTPGSDPDPGTGENKKHVHYYTCGCDDTEIYVSEVSQTIACPESGFETLVANSSDLYVKVAGADKFDCECSCGEGFQVDWEKSRNICDPIKNATRKICFPDSYVEPQEDCSCFEGKGKEYYENYILDNGCPSEEDCFEYEQLMKEGIFCAEKPELNVAASLEVCKALGY